MKTRKFAGFGHIFPPSSHQARIRSSFPLSMLGFKICEGQVPFSCLDDDETVMFFERFHGILVCSKCCQQFSLRNAGISPWQECGIKNIKGETHNLEMFQRSKCFNSNPDKLCTNIKEEGDKCVDIWQIALIPAA